MQNNTHIDPNPTKRSSLTVITNSGESITVEGSDIRDCMAKANKIKNGEL